MPVVFGADAKEPQSVHGGMNKMPSDNNPQN